LVGNLTLSGICEFYYNFIIVTSFLNIKYGDIATHQNLPIGGITNDVPLLLYCWQKVLMETILALSCTQYMATSVLQSE